MVTWSAGNADLNPLYEKAHNPGGRRQLPAWAAHGCGLPAHAPTCIDQHGLACPTDLLASPLSLLAQPRGREQCTEPATLHSCLPPAVAGSVLACLFVFVLATVLMNL